MRPPPRLLALALLLAAACFPPTTDLSNKQCDPAGKCLTGYVCVSGICVQSGATGTPCSKDGDCTVPGNVCRQGVCDTACVAPACECDLGQTQACGTTEGVCRAGSQSCGADHHWGACTGGVEPVTELCNGKDDDCDGNPDNVGEDGGFLCAQDADAGSCATNCGSTGQLACNHTCDHFVCTPPSEICNGLDDDCDGHPDNGFDCVQNADAGPCTASCGSTGHQSCKGDCSGLTACAPPPDICNGQDDDCDGNPDNVGEDGGFLCQQDVDAGSCTTVCGSTGTHACNHTCDGFTTCAPPVEVCNGLDDDCDGNPDNVGEDGGFFCASGALDGGTCATSCGTTGLVTCADDCSGWLCVAPAEVCNRVDDNCDGSVDEGLTSNTRVLAPSGVFGSVAIAATPSSGLAVYTNFPSSQSTLVIQPLDATLALKGSSFGKTPTGDQTSPTVVALANDAGFQVAWVEPATVYGLHVSAAGTPGSPSAINSTFLGPQNVSTAASSAGMAYAFENAPSGGGKHDVIVRLPNQTTEFNLTNTASGSSSTPAIAAQPDGSQFAVAYTRNATVRVAVVDPSGNKQSDAPISTGSGAGAPAVAWDGAEFVVSWQEQNAGTSSQDIAFATVGGTAVYVSPAAGTSENPRLVSGNGLLYLAWDDDRANIGSPEARMVRLAPDGGVLAGPSVLDATTDPSLAPVPCFTGTDFGVAWVGGGAASVDAKLACF